MFRSLQQAFREAVDNFRTELHRDDVPEAADRLLRAMHREVATARQELLKLESDIESVLAEARREEDEARTCLRREELARRIDDDETVRIARDHARHHLRRQEILTRKAAVLRDELATGRSEVESMTARLEEAKLQRDSLSARAGRSDAHRRFAEAEGLFSNFERMSDRISTTEHEAEAARSLNEMELGGHSSANGPSPTPSAAEIEARLAELKERVRGERGS